MNSSDEYVCESLVTFDRIKTLVYDLLVTEAWKEKIFPLIQGKLSQISNVRSYMCLFHEASLTNFLECVLYNRTACDSADDTLTELIDYGYRQFIWLYNKKEQTPDFMDEKDPKSWIKNTASQEIERQAEDIRFKAAMSCFSIIRFITDHMDSLPAPIIRQLVEHNDIPCTLVPMLEMKPWLRKNTKGETEKWEDMKW